MGEYYLVVNVAKRQFLSPSDFGDNIKWHWVPSGYHAIATAMLVCGGPLSDVAWPRSGAELNSFGQGSWYGDPIQRVGDEEQPNIHGVLTETPEEPTRNLYMMARAEFEDVSVRALAMLINDRYEAPEGLAKRVVENPYEGKLLLRNLGDLLVGGQLLEPEPASDLEKALERHVGSDWVAKYRRVCND